MSPRDFEFGEGDKVGYDWKFPENRPKENSEVDYYKVLGVDKSANSEDIEKAFVEKRAQLQKRKSDGQSYKGPLVSENEFSEEMAKLEIARKTLTEQVITGEHPVSEPTKFTVNIEYTPEEELKFAKKEAWEKIKDSKHLKAVLAYSILPEHKRGEFLSEREKMTPKNIDEFFSKYPNYNKFMETSNIMKLPSEVTTKDPRHIQNKRQQYYEAMDEFVKIMYPHNQLK